MRPRARGLGSLGKSWSALFQPGSEVGLSSGWRSRVLTIAASVAGSGEADHAAVASPLEGPAASSAPEVAVVLRLGFLVGLLPSAGSGLARRLSGIVKPPSTSGSLNYLRTGWAGNRLVVWGRGLAGVRAAVRAAGRLPLVVVGGLLGPCFSRELPNLLGFLVLKKQFVCG